jgi:glyceraldehyde 3-phosphate dehydrogenase
LRVGINGLGRIGRAIYRINAQRDLFDVVAINDINPDGANIAYLLQYDSTYGRLEQPVSFEGGKLISGRQSSTLYHYPNVGSVHWGDHDVDVVVESSGHPDNGAYLASGDGGISHMVQTYAADPAGPVKTIIFGVNEGEFDPGVHRRLSSSICDTISLSPVMKVLEDNFGVSGGSLTTVHPWLNSQNLLDGQGPAWFHPKDNSSAHALGRSVDNNLIPKSTSAVLAAEAVFPGIDSRIESFSFRVPTSIVSGAVLNVELKSDTETESVVALFTELECKQEMPIFQNVEAPLVSIDYRASEYSANIDQRWTSVRDGRKLRMVYWYDNEWGYASRVADLVALIGSA